MDQNSLSEQREKRTLPVHLLITTLFILVLVLFYLLPQDPLVAARLAAFMHPAPEVQSHIDIKALTKNDPQPGFLLPQTGIGNSIRQIAKKSAIGCLVVPVGDCAGCITVNLPAWESKATKHGLTMVLLSTGSKEDTDRFKATSHLRSPILNDNNKSFSKLLNTAWIGRPYLFSPDGHLLWLQPAIQLGFDPFLDITFSNVILQRRNIR